MIRRKLPKYVVEDKDRYGKRRVYLRRPGHKKIQLHGMPWSQAFMEAYAAAMEGMGTIEAFDSAELPAAKGTYRWLCEKYMAESSEFRRMDAETQRARRSLLESTYNEPVSPGSTKMFRDVPLSMMTTTAVEVLRDRRMDKPEAANKRVAALRQVFKFGAKHKHVPFNPARDVERVPSNNPFGYHTWTIEEVDRFEARHPVGTKAHLAMALMLYTSQRRSDAVILGKQHIKDGWIILTQFKNRNKKPIQVQIPVRPELRAVLDASPLGALTFLETELGKPYSRAGFGNWFRERCIEAKVPGRAHGLRKAAAARLAERGASEKEIMAITGHTTSKEIVRYTKMANQRVLAGHAMDRFKDK